MMYSIKLKKPQYVVFDPKKVERVTRQEDRKAMDSALIEAQSDIIEAAPVGHTGNLRASIGTRVVEKKGVLQGIVFAGVKYALPVEFGRKASPVSQLGQVSLRRWIEKSTQGRAFFSALRNSYPKITINAAVFLLARSLKRRERKGQKFFQKGLDEAWPRMQTIFRALGRKLAKRYVEVT
jgi:hypothetical protein